MIEFSFTPWKVDSIGRLLQRIFPLRLKNSFKQIKPASKILDYLFMVQASPTIVVYLIWT